jgi:8-oxo-dGTP pyrophosphatase MutT (NUDIX family)
MAIPEFVRELRSVIGHSPLWLSGVTAVVLDDGGRVLLARRADTHRWSLITGIIDPGEQPADAAVRECLEETGVHAVPELLAGVSVTEPMLHVNGDQAQYLNLTFRCRAVGGEARVNDEESVEVGWFELDALPEELNAAMRQRLGFALSESGAAHFQFGPALARTEQEDQSLRTR